jgi:hypothetical protein
MAYRDDVNALAARHDALATEVAQKTRELEESRQLLEQAWARARLPVLDQIQVASPCTADWNQMTGDDRARHCGACQKSVYNLSGMTRAEAEALLIERNGDLCVRYYQRHDGTILLADCTVGVQRKRDRRRTAARAAAIVAGGLAVAGGAAVYAAATEPTCALRRDRPREVMGAVPALPAPVITQIPEPPRPPPVPEVRPQLQVEPPPRPTMGLVSPRAWQDPQPSQPAARPTRHPAPAPDRRAR